MGSPSIFNGKFAKLLTPRAFLRSDGGILEYDGPRNYFANSHFEVTNTGWSVFNTTLTSGLPTGSITFTASGISGFGTTSGNVLAGSASLQTIASTAWVAGQGFISDPITVDRKDLGKILTYKFSYEATTGSSLINWSGILGSQTFAVYIYDITASAWLQPAGFLGMNQGTGPGVCTGTFQTSTTVGQQYRLAVIALQAPTAGAITMQWDEFSLTPQTAPIGAVVTDWVSYTPTGTWVSNTTYSGKWRRVGDSMEIRFKLALTGAPTNASLTVVAPPSGYSIDTTKLATTTNVNGEVGIARGLCAGGGINMVMGMSNVANSVWIGYQNSTAGAVNSLNSTTPATWASGDEISGELTVPITGFGGTVQMSNDTDTRVCAARYRISSNVTASSTQPVNYDTLIYDTHAAVTTSSTAWKFVAPISGYFRVSSTFYVTTTTSRFSVFLNGVENIALGVTSTAGGSVGGSATVKMSAGDYIDIRAGTSTTCDSSSSGIFNQVSIERVSGPSTIANSESVNCKYTTTGATSIPSAVRTVIPFTVKVYDSHSAYSTSTGLFTCPISGVYAITAGLNMASGGGYEMDLVKSGTFVDTLSSTGTSFQAGSTQIKCVAGDTIAVAVNQGGGSTFTTSSGTSTNAQISIARIGN